MDIIDSLLKDHGNLRRRAADLQAMLGPECGVGWSDCTECDIDAFRQAVSELLHELLDHEAREELALGKIWELRGRRPDIQRLFDDEHAEINELVGLLRAAAAVCDGRHVYQVRSVVERLREGLEAHLAHEEKEVFPRVRRPGGRLTREGSRGSGRM